MSQLVSLFNELEDSYRSSGVGHDKMSGCCERFLENFFNITASYEHKCPPSEFPARGIVNPNRIIVDEATIDTLLHWASGLRLEIQNPRSVYFKLIDIRLEQYSHGFKSKHDDYKTIPNDVYEGLFRGVCKNKQQQYRSVVVKPECEFASIVLNDNLSFSDETEVLFVLSQSWSSVLAVARAIIVNYCLLFDNLGRLKVCSFPSCDRLLIEYRLDRKKFCGPYCKRKSHTTQENIEKIRCRERQNKFVSSRIDKWDGKNFGDRIYKIDCNTCNNFVKGGACKLLIVRNRDALKAILGETYFGPSETT